MGRSRHCLEEQHTLMKNLIGERKTYQILAQNTVKKTEVQMLQCVHHHTLLHIS